jgi:ubiquinone/menaquinone biosynthesis C-methylase UbiE
MSSVNIHGSLWSEKANDWAEFQEQVNSPLFEAMLNATLVRQGTRFLDVGCGSGGSSMLAASRGADVAGIDAASGLLSIAKKRVPSGDFRVGDMEKLPFDDHFFDVVFAANSIQFADDSTNALREFKRVCRPRGYIIIGLFGEPQTVESAAIMKAAVTSLFPDAPPGTSPFALSFRDRLEALFASAELEILTQQFVNCPFIYPDVETYLKAIMSSGPFVAMTQKVGTEKVAQAILDATQSMITEDGEVRIEQNHFQYLVAKTS